MLSWLYPTRCMACGQIIPIQEKERRRHRLCSHCSILFEKLEPPLCKRCGYPLTESQAIGTAFCDYCPGRDYAFESNVSAYPYEGAMREVLHDIKFRGRKQAAIGLGELWADTVRHDIPPVEYTLMPVPMHKSKVRQRGFNQAEVLATAVAKATGAPLINDLLIRTVNTPPQSGLNASDRIQNVRGVFELNKKFSVKGKVIILIDDIFTTGASLDSCSQVLKEAGAEKIYCVTLTIALRGKKSVI